MPHKKKSKQKPDAPARNEKIHLRDPFAEFRRPGEGDSGVSLRFRKRLDNTLDSNPQVDKT